MNRTLLIGPIVAAWIVAAFPGPAAAQTVTLSPVANHPKGSTAVTGSGFSTSEAVDLYYDLSDVMLVATNGSGSFGAHSLNIPANALPGTHWITAIGRRTGDAAQAALTVRTDWAERGFSALGRRKNPYENVLSPGNVGTLDIAWIGKTGGLVDSSPAYGNGNIYVGSSDGYLYAFAASTGTRKWKTLADGCALWGGPAVSGNFVYIGTTCGHVYAFNAIKGSVVWTQQGFDQSGFSASPAVDHGVVYISSLDGYLRAFNATTGADLWGDSSPNIGSSISSPAVANGIVYVGTQSGQLYALNAADGTAAWAGPVTTGGAIDSSPAVANGIVYFGSADDNVYAVRAVDGHGAWPPYATAGGVYSSPSVVNGTVFVGSLDKTLYALDAKNGTVKWKQLVGAVGYSSPATGNGVVFIADRTFGTLYAFDSTKSDASPLWSLATGGPIDSAPIVADGMVFVGSEDHNLYAFALNGGENAAYKRSTSPPRFATLHPNLHLKLQR